MAKTKVEKRQMPEIAEGALTLEDFPNYVAAKQRLDRVRARQSELERELLELTGGREVHGSAKSKVDEAAEDILNGKEFGDRTLPRAKIRKIEDELRATTRATELAEHAYQSEWMQASAEVVRSRRGEHIALVRSIAKHLTALVGAVEAEADWIQGLRKGGLHFTPGLGGIVNPQSPDTRPLFQSLRGIRLERYLDRLKKAGY